MAQTGLGKGLAVEHDFNSDINRLYQRENMRSQINVEKQRKTKFYSEMLKKPHVRGEYNNGRLETHIKDVNGRLADFVTANPGWETDPGLFAQFSTITDEYIQNDIVQEDEQVKENYDAFQAKMHTGTMSKEDIDRNIEEYANYTQNGGDPYMFMNAEEVRTNDLLQASASILKADTYPEAYQEHGITAYRNITKVPDGALQAAVNADFAIEENARAIIAEYNQVGGEKIAPTAKQYWNDRLRGATSESIRRAGFDRLEYYNATTGADKTNSGVIPTSYYQQQVLDRIDQTIVKYEKSGDPADLYFRTKARPEFFDLSSWAGVNSQVSISKKDNYRFASTTKAQKDEGITSLDMFNFSAEVIALGSPSYVFDNYNSYIETGVKIPVPIASSAMISKNDGKDINSLPADDEAFENDLLAHGFTYRTEETLDWSQIGTTKAKKVKYLYGVLQAPAIEDEMAQRKFDGVLSTEEERDNAQAGVYQQGAYERGQIQDPVDVANQYLPNENFSRRESDGQIVSENGLYGWDDKVNQYYILEE